MPRVGVVIPCYNHAEYVVEAVQSVAWQTGPVWNVVIVDDGSDPPLEEALFSEFGGVHESVINTSMPFVEILRHDTNLGVSAARNTGIAHLIERYFCDVILPLDADDILERTMVEDGLQVIEWGFDIAYPDCTYDGIRRGPARFPMRSTEELKKQILVSNEIINTSMFKSWVWEAVKEKNGEGYDTSLRRWGWEDWLFWIEALLVGAKAKGIGKALLRYRVHEDSRVKRSNEQALNIWSHFQAKLLQLYGVNLPDRG